MIRLHLLGSAEIETPASTITPSQEIVFATALYLVLERERPTSRGRLAALLWPSAEAAIRSHRLRQTLLQLKRLGVELTTNRDTVKLASEQICVDVEGELPGCDSSAAWPTHIDVLGGYDPTFSAPFAEWLDVAKRQVQLVLLDGLVPKLESARGCGDWASANRLAGYCLDLDPWNETALLTRAEALAMRGQKSAALDLLDKYIQEITPRNPNVAVPAKILRNRVSRYTPTTVMQLSSREPEWVGRHVEMLALTNELAKAREGRGAACLIKGDAGIGKTRLASELAKFAVLQGVRVERVACRQSETDQPLSVFVALVPKLRELPGALGADQESLRILRRLTDFNFNGDREKQGRDPIGVYSDLKAAIFDLLDAVLEERPLVIIVDDVQWLDSASANLLGAMLDWLSTRKLFLVLNSRDDSIIERYVTSGVFVALRLEPLGATDAQTVITETARHSGVDVSPSELAWLTRTSDGNPYFLQELTKHWIETGKSQEIPPSVVGVLQERISRLTDHGRQLLQACSALGENANVERLERVLELPPYQLLASLEEVSSTGMISLGTAIEGEPPELRVRHDLLGSAALSKLSSPSIKFLHRRCGYALEREVLGSTISVSLLRACAFHWQQAGDLNRAFELSVKCASFLLAIGLAGDASAALEGVLTYCTTPDQQIQVLTRIVEAHKLARDSSGVLKTIARIRALQGGEERVRYHDHLEIMEFEEHRISESSIDSLFERTLVCIYDSGLDSSHRLSAASVALKLASSLADLREIERIHTEVKPLLSDTQLDSRLRLQVEVIYHTMVGDLHEALRFAKDRVVLERQSGSWLQLANSITDLAFVLRRSGPLEDVPRILGEAYEVATNRKLYAAARDYAEKLAEHLIESDRKAAELWLNRAKQTHGAANEVQTEFSATVVSARLALLDGRVADAMLFLDRLPRDWLKHRHGGRAAAVALRLMTSLACDAPPDGIRGDVLELRSLYERIAPLGGQDYEISALCMGLLHLHAYREARWYFRDYVSNKRRELTPFSRELSEMSALVAGLQGESGASSGISLEA